jgi:hypothetical protein
MRSRAHEFHCTPHGNALRSAPPDGKGGLLVVLPRDVLDRLKAILGAGESYSDVILWIAKGD